MRWDPLSRQFLVYWGGGSPPPQTSTTQVTQTYSPEEAARRAKLMSEAERIYNQTQGSAQALSPTGPSADTLQAQNMMRQMAETSIPGMTSDLSKATSFGLHDVLYPESNPALQATINTATRRIGNAFTDPGGVLQKIRDEFTAGNTEGSGTRSSIAGGIAGREYLNAIGDVTGKLSSDAYTKGLDTFSRTMALAPQNMTTSLLPAQLESGIGAQNEAYAEQQRQWQLQAPWAALGPYASIVSGMSNPSTSTTSTVPGPTKNPMAPIGLAMMGASLFPANPMIGAGAGLMLGLFS